MSEDCYAAALEQASALDGESKLTATILGYLAKACAAQGKNKMAATMHERQLIILAGLDETGPSAKMARASILLELVSIYGKLGRHDEAEPLRAEVGVLMDGIKEPKAPPARKRRTGMIEEGDDEDGEDESDESDDEEDEENADPNEEGADANGPASARAWE